MRGGGWIRTRPKSRCLRFPSNYKLGWTNQERSYWLVYLICTAPPPSNCSAQEKAPIIVESAGIIRSLFVNSTSSWTLKRDTKTQNTPSDTTDRHFLYQADGAPTSPRSVHKTPSHVLYRKPCMNVVLAICQNKEPQG